MDYRDYLERCKDLDRIAIKDWLLRQEPFQMVKEPSSEYIKMDFVLQGSKLFHREDLLTLSDLFNRDKDGLYPLRVSDPSWTGPITLGNTPYYKLMGTFPLSLGYDRTVAPHAVACNKLVLRFSSVDDPLLVEVLRILQPYLEPLDSSKLFERTDYYP